MYRIDRYHNAGWRAARDGKEPNCSYPTALARKYYRIGYEAYFAYQVALFRRAIGGKQ